MKKLEENGPLISHRVHVPYVFRLCHKRRGKAVSPKGQQQ